MKRIEAVETWNGPGRSDEVIVPLSPQENAVHPLEHRHYFEHWYFDARLDDGHVVVGFVQTAELITRKPGVELHVYRPDGAKLSVVKGYPPSAVRASADRCDVVVGGNHCSAVFPVGGGLPRHYLQLEEEGMGFDLTFDNVLPGWKPGGGMTRYGDEEFFAWVVPAPRARVSGTVRYDGREHAVTGTGYHDHNWGVGDMKRIIDYWYWGRLYAEDVTLLYAYVMTRERYGQACSKPLMLAVEDEVVLSTGEMTLVSGGTVFDEAGNREYPRWLRLAVPGEVELELQVRRVIDAHDFVEDLPVVRRQPFKAALNRLVGRPGYFRFQSDYSLRWSHNGGWREREGTTLHEMVALR